jgi:protein O-mannosyl-transferase
VRPLSYWATKMLTRSSIAIGLSLLCLVAFAYWPGLPGGFIFDDYPNLVHDPDWKVSTLDIDAWRRAVGHGIATDGGRPLALLTFAANHYLAGPSPWAMKLTNVLMHCACAWLAYLLILRLLGLAWPNVTARGRTAWAFALAAIWALHPLQVSTVLYVVQRMEIGAQLFTLAFLCLYIDGRARQMEGRGVLGHAAGALGCLLLGAGFKESAALGPVYALALEVFLLHFATSHSKPDWRLVGTYATACALAIAAFVILILPRYADPEAYAGRTFTLGGRLLSQPPILLEYLRSMLVPSPAFLLFYYDHISAPATFGSARVIAGLVGLGAIVAAAAASIRRMPLTGLGLTWFLAAHALTSNVIPLELAFEHRNYFALLGVVLAVAGLVGPALNSGDPAARRLVAGSLIAGLVFLTHLQARIWGDPTQLAMTLEGRNPASPRAAHALGVRFYELSHGVPARPGWSLALKQFERVATLPGDSPLGEQAMVVMLGRAGRPIPEPIWRGLEQKLSRGRLTPEDEMALYSIVSCRVEHACRLDDQRLFALLMTAVRANPASDTVHVQLANFAQNVMRDTPLAVRMLERAVELAPAQLSHRINLLRLKVALNLLAPEVARREVARLSRLDRDGIYRSQLSDVEHQLTQTGSRGSR